MSTGSVEMGGHVTGSASCTSYPASHPLAEEEWLASLILQRLAANAAIDVQALCKLSLLNKNFFAAFNSDLVWRKLLPRASHLDLLLNECDDALLLESYRNNSLSKQALYQRLCQPISLAGGLKKFWLDRATGGECYMISARALNIAWGSTPEYWDWLPCSGAWFPVVAFLRSVCWFDVTGKFQQLLRPGSYTVSFRMQIHSTWGSVPVKLSLQNITYGQDNMRSRALSGTQFPRSDPPLVSPPSPPERGQPISHDSELSGCDCHEWIECDVGEFTVEEKENSPVEVEFSMREVEVLNWKSGIVLDGVLVRPTCVVNAHERATISVGSVYGYSDDEWMDDVEYDAERASNDEDTGGFIITEYNNMREGAVLSDDE